MSKVLTLSAATCLLAGMAVAQTPTPNRANPPSTTVAPGNTSTDQGHNPAVAANSNANDSTVPVKGSNSFTAGQARDRMVQRGYSNVSDLKKDNDGVWRGHAEHSGSDVQVWMDYKGNIGEAR
jgi:periplasmic protein CpxP/Spy